MLVPGEQTKSMPGLMGMTGAPDCIERTSSTVSSSSTACRERSNSSFGPSKERRASRLQSSCAPFSVGS
jgi:hypothetical protein